MELNWVHLIKRFTKESTYSFQLIFWKSNLFCELGLGTLKEQLDWHTALSSICILSDLRSDFNVLQKTATGSYSVVYQVADRTSGQSYAMKLYTKADLPKFDFPCVGPLSWLD